jgi:hypothetical protein
VTTSFGFFVFLIAMLPLISFAMASVNYNAYAFDQVKLIKIASNQLTHHHVTSTNAESTTMLRWGFVKIGVANNQVRPQSIIFDENNRGINFAKSDYSSQLSQCASGNIRMSFGYRLIIEWERHKWALKYKLSILLNGLQRSSSSLVME